VRSFRLPMIVISAIALPLLATTAFAATHAGNSPAAAAAAPTAAELLAKVASCTPASTGKYATDEGEAATINICKTGTAYHWTSDLDIDCDGITTARCSHTTDPAYYNETSFQTSTGAFFTADVTHYFVVPLPSSRFNYSNAGIKPGNVGAVIYNNKVVYAVFADEGPDDIIGEASYATAQALGIDPNPATGGTAGPATFIVFTGTVPSPVENNTVIDQVGAAAASAFVGTGGPTTGPTTTPPTTAPPTTTPPATGGQITGIGGKCVDVAGASSTDGAGVQLYTCNGTTAQKWTRNSDNTFRALGKCLDVKSASTANGARVQLYTCNGTAAQKWTATGGQLVNTGSGKCLDATGVSSADGTPLQIWTCGTGSNQKWNVPA
jgi:Ricin-type beta-trefoil lectin domain/Fungal chitosanase of glycosyl hydrolase group 75